MSGESKKMITWNKWNPEIIDTNEQHFFSLHQRGAISACPMIKRLKPGAILIKFDDEALRLLIVKIEKVENTEKITFLTESGEDISSEHFSYWLDQDFSNFPILR